MRKRILLWLPVLVIALTVVLPVLLLNSPMVRLEYAEGESGHINPSRGFYYPVKSDHPERLSEAGSCSIVQVLYDIGDFAGSDLSSEKLDELDTVLEEARGRGFKVILRPAYGFGGDAGNKDPADIAQVLSHIRQMKPLLGKHGDVLYAVQAGFLGGYGEWNDSNLGDPPPVETQAALLKELLSDLPSNVYVCIRRPSFIRELFRENLLDRSYEGRIGVFNDGLLGNETDWGTYTDLSREEELLWAQDYFLELPYGGEACAVSGYSGAQNAVREFASLHLSYLNESYNQDVISGWAGEEYRGVNALGYMERHLGYRFSLQTARLPRTLKPGEAFSAELYIYNSGFASLLGNYKVNLVLAGEQTKLVIPLDTGVKTWRPGQPVRLAAASGLPLDLPDGSLRVGLQIADAGESLAGDDRYAVALENRNVDFSGGINYFAAYQKTDEGYILQ